MTVNLDKMEIAIVLAAIHVGEGPLLRSIKRAAQNGDQLKYEAYCEQHGQHTELARKLCKAIGLTEEQWRNACTEK